ncbi:MAG: YaaC family protein [Candidatus Thiodiazotropha sp.]
MARLPDARVGDVLEIKGRKIPFSLYPTVRTNRRYGLQSKMFAANPWSVINQSIQNNCPDDAKRQALAFIEQAEDFYKSSQASTIVAAKPLLIYYCFLNLAKSYVLHKGVRTEYGSAYHGLAERVRTNGREFYNSFLNANQSTNPGKPNIFDDFMLALTGLGLPVNNKEYELSHLLGQLLQGHRMWCDGSRRKERFIEINRAKFMCDAVNKNIWMELELFADDLSRFDISRKALLSESGLDGLFKEVKSELTEGERKILRFEQVDVIHYTDRPSDELRNLVESVRFKVWATIMRIPPYRKYYLYLCPASEQNDLLPQILSIWGVFYYLGSVTRYRPQYFDELLAGRFGGHIQEIVSNLPQQFLYYMASEFSNREIAHAPLV